jgi:hypothetical protein
VLLKEILALPVDLIGADLGQRLFECRDQRFRRTSVETA